MPVEMLGFVPSGAVIFGQLVFFLRPRKLGLEPMVSQRTERTAGGAFLYRFSRFLLAAGFVDLPVCDSSSSASLSGLG